MRRVSVGYEYDKECDATQWRGCYNPTKFGPTTDPLKKTFNLAKLSAASRAHGSKIKAAHAPERERREEAENNAAEAVRRAVGALEMALHELNQTRAPSSYARSVNQKQLHNAVMHLKTKCGVHFDRDEFSIKVDLDR